jgi:hypothetical protein
VHEYRIDEIVRRQARLAGESARKSSRRIRRIRFARKRPMKSKLMLVDPF